MIRLTLRQRFTIGLVAILVVGWLTLNVGRLSAMAVMFQYLEREYVVNLPQVRRSMDAIVAVNNATPLDKAWVLDLFQRSRAIGLRADSELFAI